MAFPLADWIEAHADLPHNLGISGMVGQLRSLKAAVGLRLEPDEEALRGEIARLHGVPRSGVFLTHGATEGNALSLGFLAREIRRETGKAPVAFTRTPEYPPILHTAELFGFRTPAVVRTPDVAVFSEPNNPSGVASATDLLSGRFSGARRALVDEVFREFSGRPSLARRGDVPGLWVVGSLTKAYGADDYRVGWVVPSEGDREGFRRYHGLVLDRVPKASVAAGRGILAHRTAILREARAIFRQNLRELRRRVPGVPQLVAPLWFDRGDGGIRGDELAETAARHGVLVSPGSLFGDATGVRVTLTRRSFPLDLAAYLSVRQSFVPGRPRSD